MEESAEKKFTTNLIKLENFCAFKERCISEVEDKMYKLEIEKSEMKSYLDVLLEENFINEIRFVNSYIRGKINIKRDGLAKIYAALRLKKINEKIIKQVFEELNLDTYQENIKLIISKKWEQLILKNEKLIAKQKLIFFLKNKGYRYDDWKEIVKKLN